MKKSLWGMALVAVLEAILIMTIVPGDWTARVIQQESVLVEEHLGSESKEWISGKAYQWYRSSVIDSGVYHKVYRFLIPTEEQKKQSVGMENMGTGWFAWVEKRLESLANSIYHFYTRLALLTTWAPYFLILLIPSAFDGFTTWRIKRTNFDYVSPVLHRYSLQIIVVLILGMSILFMAPIVMTPILIPVVIACICVLSGVVFGNIQKRV